MTPLAIALWAFLAGLFVGSLLGGVYVELMIACAVFVLAACDQIGTAKVIHNLCNEDAHVFYALRAEQHQLVRSRVWAALGDPDMPLSDPPDPFLVRRR